MNFFGSLSFEELNYNATDVSIAHDDEEIEVHKISEVSGVTEMTEVPEVPEVPEVTEVTEASEVSDSFLLLSY